MKPSRYTAQVWGQAWGSFSGASQAGSLGALKGLSLGFRPPCHKMPRLFIFHSLSHRSPRRPVSASAVTAEKYTQVFIWQVRGEQKLQMLLLLTFHARKCKDRGTTPVLESLG